jgi:hypothetical protein
MLRENHEPDAADVLRAEKPTYFFDTLACWLLAVDVPWVPSSASNQEPATS